jgi:hypothetical protein
LRSCQLCSYSRTSQRIWFYSFLVRHTSQY